MIETIRDNLTRLMQARGTNATRLAREADVGDSAVKDIFRGRNQNPGINVLAALARALDCTIGEILGESTPDGGGKPGEVTAELVLDAMIALDTWMGENNLDLPDPEYKREIVVGLAQAALEDRNRPDGDKVIDMAKYTKFIRFG